MSKSARETYLSKAIAPVVVLAFITFACLASLLYVNEGNNTLKENNRWQVLAQEESRYVDIQVLMSKRPKTLPQSLWIRSRELASRYRETDRQDKAADIYLALWLSQCGSGTPDKTGASYSPSFVADARELAGLYTDMAAFSSAIESYQKILQYDQTRLSSDDPAIACDLNNLGQCYYTAGCAEANKPLRQKYFSWAKEQFSASQRLGGRTSELDKKVLRMNQELLVADLNGFPLRQNMEQSSIVPIGDRGR